MWAMCVCDGQCEGGVGCLTVCPAVNLGRVNRGDDHLPMSHTCFFSVELPSYSSEERMLWGLRTACHYGSGGMLIS